MPETLCGGRLSVDQVQRLIRIDGHPIGITEMEYRVLELLAFARNNVVTRAMLLKHLYRRADDQPQPKIIDVFISKLRKKLRNASGGAEFIETIPQRGWILRDIDEKSGASLERGFTLLLASRGLLRAQCCICPVQHGPKKRPQAYSEAVSRLASVRHALRLVDPFGGGPAPTSMTTRRSPRPGTMPRRPGASCFDRRSERLIGAATAGIEALLVEHQQGPRAALRRQARP